jgi:hypothetical protein
MVDLGKGGNNSTFYWNKVKDRTKKYGKKNRRSSQAMRLFLFYYFLFSKANLLETSVQLTH